MSWGLGLNCCWDTGMHLQGWLHSGVSVALTAMTLPWRAGAEESHCRHSTAHFNVMWTSVITVQAPSPHITAKTSQRSSSAHSTSVPQMWSLGSPSQVHPHRVLSPLLPAAGPASTWGSTSVLDLGRVGVSAEGALSVQSEVTAASRAVCKFLGMRVKRAGELGVGEGGWD